MSKSTTANEIDAAYILPSKLRDSVRILRFLALFYLRDIPFQVDSHPRSYPSHWRSERKKAWYPPPKKHLFGIATIYSFQQII